MTNLIKWHYLALSNDIIHCFDVIIRGLECAVVDHKESLLQWHTYMLKYKSNWRQRTKIGKPTKIVWGIT